MSLYTLLKFLHVLLVIVAVGFNASYGIWLIRAAKEPEHEAHVLRGIKVLDDRFANPAYALILLTGMSMVIVGDLSFATFWISAGLGLYVVVAVMAITLFSPMLRRRIALAESGDLDSDEYRRLAKQSGVVGSILAILVVMIVFLMVTKPTF